MALHAKQSPSNVRMDGNLEGTEIAVPASVANIGPGFDTLAVAVQLYLRLRIRKVDWARKNELDFDFCGRPPKGENSIERAFRMLAGPAHDFPALSLEVRSEIPMQSGLGSSSAAIVAGLRLYERLFGPLPIQQLLTTACQLEGHPDNTSAALLGGMVTCCQRQNGSVLALPCAWPATLLLLVLTPEVALDTPKSRQVLPDKISRTDAVFNLQRATLLLQALQTADYGLLREALDDRWHQPYRKALVPGLEKALMLEHPDLLGIFLSGSGPSIVALAEQNFGAVEALLADFYAPLDIPFQIRRLKVHPSSARFPQSPVPEPRTVG